jgi:SAM-dependent methyltransferase
MKGRESDMPEEEYWRSFFDADCIVSKLECAKRKTDCIAEFGCGYGTFTLAVARQTSGTVYAIDIEEVLIELVHRRAFEQGLLNVRPEVRDFMTDGTGLPDNSVDHVMLYNILHIEEPLVLLQEAFRILRPGATASVIHWKYDPDTPRGPSLDIRPSPEQCRAWGKNAGFTFVRYQDLSECCRYHYGILLMRPGEQMKSDKK